MNMESPIKDKFNQYPDDIKPLLTDLRELIIECAKQLNSGKVEESLKWGEPSYSVKDGSPIRIDWKAKTPELYYMFFNCNTKLVDTFRELYADVLKFEDNRAIVIDTSCPAPKEDIKHCIELALRYQKIKHLPLLGQ